MYPPKFNLYRISRGIKKPKKEYYSYHVAKEKAGLRLPTYSKAIQLTDIEKTFLIILSMSIITQKRK